MNTEQGDRDVNNKISNYDKNWKENVEKYFDIALTSFIVIAACILFYFILFKFNNIRKIIKLLLSVVSPVIVGFAFAYVLNPVVMFLEKRLLKLYYRIIKKDTAACDGENQPDLGGGQSEEEELNKNTRTANKNKRADKNAKTDKSLKASESDKNSEASGTKGKDVNKEHEVCDDNAECTNQNIALIGPEKTARRVSILLTVIVTIALIILLISAVIPAFTQSLSRLVDKFPEYYQTASDSLIRFVDRHAWIKKQIPDAGKLLQKFDIMQMMSDYLNSILSAAYNWVVIIFKVVYNVVIGLIVAIYLLGGKERYIGQLKKLTFAIMKPKKAKNLVQIFSDANQIFKSAILGKILDSIIIGCICFIGMSIIGMCGREAIADNRILVSVIVGVTNVIPFFGPYIGGIPSVILILCENPVDGLIFAIFIVALQQFDCNFLDPRIVGRSVGLSPLYVLVFCLTGGGLFGVLGMLIGSPTGAVIYGLTKSWVEERLEQKNLPKQTIDYVNTPGAILYADSLGTADENEQEVRG